MSASLPSPDCASCLKCFSCQLLCRHTFLVFLSSLVLISSLLLSLALKSGIQSQTHSHTTRTRLSSSGSHQIYISAPTPHSCDQWLKNLCIVSTERVRPKFSSLTTSPPPVQAALPPVPPVPHQFSFVWWELSVWLGSCLSHTPTISPSPSVCC